MNRAFTLIELIVTIAIVAILSTMAAVAYTGIRERSRDAQRMNDLSQLKLNLTTYYNDKKPQVYPISASKAVLNNTNDILFTSLVPDFARAIPVDPTNSGIYVYRYISNGDGTDYTLHGTLENEANNKGWGGGTEWVADGYQLKPD